MLKIEQGDLRSFPIYHIVAAVIYAQVSRKEDARRESDIFMKMRPTFIANIEAELTPTKHPADGPGAIDRGSSKGRFSGAARRIVASTIGTDGSSIMSTFFTLADGEASSVRLCQRRHV